jgi:hypothetical protein
MIGEIMQGFYSFIRKQGIKSSLILSFTIIILIQQSTVHDAFIDNFEISSGAEMKGESFNIVELETHETKDFDNLKNGHHYEGCDQDEGCGHDIREADLENTLLNTQLLQSSGTRNDPVALDVTIKDGGGDGEVYDPEDGLIIRGDIVTMDDDLTVIENGRLVIQGEMIVAVLDSDDRLPGELNLGGAKTIDSGGYIFPGLINGHNHVHYNCMPIWDAPGTYTNRYQWNKGDSYKHHVTYPNKALKQGNYYNVFGEAMKYAEVKELVSGTTAVQNSKMATKGYEEMMVRNIEFSNYGGPRAHATVGAVGDFDQDKADGYISNFESGTYNAMFLHIAEGLDEKSRQEYDTLKELGLARKELIVIHGAALGENELDYMGKQNMSMVWSPVSNLILYGGTAKIPTALEEGVNVCLGTDWSPSGGKNLLMELKIADQYDDNYFGNVIEDSDLVRMVTSNPADALSWSSYSGRIKEGLFADIAVYNKVDDDPYRSLIDSTEVDVQLVVIGGDPLYGNVEYMEALKPGDHEVIETPFGFSKAIDVTKEKDDEGSDIFMGNQKLSEMKVTLEDCLEFDMQYIEENFRGDWVDDGISFEEYVDQEFSKGIVPIKLDPIFHCVDQWFFDSLKNINYGNFEFGVQEKYYKFMINGTNVDDPGGGIVTPGNGKIDPNSSITITGVRRSPETVDTDQNITVHAMVRSNLSITTVRVHYRLSNGPEAKKEMTADGENYSANIGSFPKDSLLTYFINVTDKTGSYVRSEEFSINIQGGGSDDDDTGNGNPNGSAKNNIDQKTTLIIIIAVLFTVFLVVVIVLLILVKRKRKEKK